MSMFSKCETSREVAALSLLCVAEAVTYTSLDDEAANTTEEWLVKCASASGFHGVEHLQSVFNRSIVDELLFYRRGGGSSKWPQKIHDLIKCTHNVYIQNLYDSEKTPSAVKDEVKGPQSRYKCQICGVKEHTCSYVVHAIGNNANTYDASNWMTGNTRKLYNVYKLLIEKRNAMMSERRSKSSSEYSGIIVPGQTCLNRLVMTLNVQDVIPDAFLDTHTALIGLFSELPDGKEHGLERIELLEIDPCETISNSRVQKIARLLDQIHDSQKSLYYVHPKSDKHIKEHVLSKFSNTHAHGNNENTIEFLSKAYDRMAETLDRTDNKGKCKKRAVEESDEEDESEEEDEDYDDDDWLEDDDDDDDTEHQDKQRDQKRARKQRTCVVLDDDDDENDENDDEENDDENGTTEVAQPESVVSARRPWGQRPSTMESSMLDRGVAASSSQPRFKTLSEAVQDAETFENLEGIRGLRAPPRSLLPSRKKTLSNFGHVILDVVREGSYLDISIVSSHMAYTSTTLDTIDRHAVVTTAPPSESHDILFRLSHKYKSEGRTELLDATCAMILLGYELSFMSRGLV